MDLACQLLFEGPIHQSVPLDGVQALKRIRGDVHPEVGLATALCAPCHACVPRVLTGLVLYDQPARTAC